MNVIDLDSPEDNHLNYDNIFSKRFQSNEDSKIVIDVQKTIRRNIVNQDQPAQAK